MSDPNRRELAAVLQQLSTAFETGTLTEVGEIYRRAETVSIAMIPAKASKPMIMQVVRKHLMKHFGAEILRIGTDITARELEGYDITTELAKLVGELESYG